MEPNSIDRIYWDAAQIISPSERQAYLDQACGDDVGLRRKVEQFLELRSQAEDFLESPAPAPVVTVAAEPIGEGPGTVIGPYKLLEPIGEGGMGTVWMAQQTKPVRRLVAVKLVKPGMDSRQVIARFEAERQALALMDHPNIAKVLDAGTTAAGRPYFVMDLVKGVPITKYCDEHRLTPRQRLELFVPVCAAVQHAHQKGIIHRDLKPSNVLVALYDGRPVPKVIDFGVAKAAGQPLTEKTLVTGFGNIVGTPEYMSPEQAEFNQLDIDTRSDVYSLGVLLYELLTGSPPFTRQELEKPGMLEMLRVIREEEPTRPSTKLSTAEGLPTLAANRGTEPAKLTRLVRGELDWIVMKALEKDRNRRYETANAFAADVRRYLSDEPVQAVPPSAGYRFRKFARRNKAALVTASVVALVVSVAVAVSAALIWRANQDLKHALQGERREAYFQRITVAHRELSIDNLAAALRALEQCPEDLRGWEWHYLMRLCKVEPLVIRDETEVNGVAFSPDGERLASAGGDGTVKVWDSTTGKRVRLIAKAHTDSVVSVAFHPHGKHIASVGADNRVKVWNLAATDKELFNEPCDVGRKFGTACTAAFSSDGRLLAAGSDGVVTLWDWESRQVLYTLPGQERNAISVAFSPNGGRLASASTGENVKLWDLDGGGQLLRTFPAHPHPVSALAFSPDGGRLAEASLGRCVNLWDTTTGELGHTLVHTGNVLGVAFSPDGQRLASASEDKTVRVWDATTGREVLGLRGHTGMCACVAFSPDPDGWRLASASTDGTIRIWDATPLRGNEGQEVLTLVHEDEIRSVVFSPDGRRIASAGLGSLVKTWDAATGVPGVESNAHATIVFCLAWQPPDGRRIALASWNGRLHTVQVWDVRDKRVVFTLPPGLEWYVVAFSPDGRYLVTGRGSSGVVEVWDARTGGRIHTLGTHKREIRGLVFSPRGGHLASASGDGEVKLWDATRLHEKQGPRIPPIRARVPGPGLNVAFSPDGRWLATGGEENTVKIWDAQTGEPVHTLRGHTGEVYAVAVSPDGRWLASGGEDSTVRVWDSHNEYRLVRSFRGHTGLVSSLAFNSDGRLVSGSRDKTVKVWDVTQLAGVPGR